MSANYQTDKKGWVLFKNPKIPKIKLRAYISDLAKNMSKGTEVTVEESRQLLISYYDTDGLEGVSRCYNLKMMIKYGAKVEENETR
jgi:hypothetical protein